MKKESRPYHSTTKTSLTNSFFKGLLLLALLLFGKGYSTILWAQTGYFIQGEQEQGDVELINRGETFRGFKLHPVTGMPYESDVDTIALDYYKRTTVEGKGLAVGYNGNLIGPRHFKTYFDRTYPINPFIFGDTYQGLLYAQPSIRFYDTRSPCTNMLYQRNGSANQREEELDMTMALNIGKPISLGGDFNYTLSRGQYIGNLSQGVSYRLFGSLSLPRYELYASAGNNYLRMNENGGIKDDDYINNPMGLGGGEVTSNLSKYPCASPVVLVIPFL
ncbi:putative porin [Porphyromonas gingivicanis]|uniref:putative porin n=1 Tax=Porphyromonas gingivicanis TaxID=266762 RepID=UPI000689081D|nr:putative porin [Porphyromonas gingivicanis]